LQHAEVLIERILLLDGTPSMMPPELKVGGTVKAMIESDLRWRGTLVKHYDDAVALATKEGDNRSRGPLVHHLLKDEEERVDFLEAQMHQIKEVGCERLSAHADGEERGTVTGLERVDSLPENVTASTHYFTVTLSNCAPLTT
jgi:bacterioferritin